MQIVYSDLILFEELQQAGGPRGMDGARKLGAGVVVVLLLASLSAIAVAQSSAGFADIDGNTHEADIDAIAAAGITKGCNPPTNDRYCPDDPVTRAQMASFFVRALDLDPASSSDFTDTTGNTHETDIDAIAAAGITKGCNPPSNDRYCPDDPVTRAQMASFFVRALDLDPAPSSTTSSTSTTAPSTPTTTAPTTTTTTQPAACPAPQEFGIVGVPFDLTFDSDAGGLCDVNDVGTGFRVVDPTTDPTRYIKEKLLVASGELAVTTTKGLAFETDNDQDNALGVGINPPQEVLLVETEVVEPEFIAGSFAQAGLWFGNDEDDYVKLVVQSRNMGLRIEMLEERGAAVFQARVRASSDLSTSSRFGLRLMLDPVNNIVTGYYRLDGGEWRDVESFVVPGELFTADNATLPPGETRTFTGIMASHRNADTELDFRFEGFGITESADPPPPPSGGISFDRVTVADVWDPTAMAMGPDGRLYVATVFGDIYRITLNPETHVATSVEQFDTLKQFYGQACRLTLGLDVDPDSTPSNVAIWVASAKDECSTLNGEIDTASIVRISGSDLGTVEEFATGLPRSNENHSLNSLRFGPDGRLYVAAGGLTGAGHTPESCCRGQFGNRWEQPLSAALLVLEVKDPGWDLSEEGQCSTGVRDEPNPIPDPETGGPDPVPNFPNRIDELASWTCGAEVFASGFRNMYDFVFHSNGQIYGADNGLGVSGTFPPESTPDCRYTNGGDSVAFGDVTPYTEGGDAPGEQPDLLHRIVAGGYYGHPNPSRDECVFMDGSFQGVSPTANYRPPIYDLGVGRSANGIIEYASDAFCGALQGDLLITNFSSGGDITRVTLSADGTAVAGITEKPGLLSGFDSPLPLVEGPDGTIYVGEFDQSAFGSGGKITAMVPDDAGCFQDISSMPAGVLDPGSAALDGRMYVVGGKIDSTSGPVHVNSLYVYDPATDQWFTGPDKGGSAVENPAVAAHNGKIYVFGGSTAPFSGFSDEVWIYTPGGINGDQGSWTSGSSDEFTARAGATAETLNNQIYVIGGLGCSDGAINCPSAQVSFDSVQIYNPATNTWTNGPTLGTPRDNAGSAILDGNIYVLGGRTWNGDETLNTVEYLNAGSWQPRASMPTGRRSFITGTINGNAQIMGGEAPLTTANEQYDPTTNTWTTLIPMNPGRHGSAHTTINNTLYIAGGGTQTGTSFTNTATKFILP